MTPNSYYYEKDDYRNSTRVGPEIDLSTRLQCKQNNCFQNILFFFIENRNLLIDQLLSIRNNRTLQAKFGSQKGKKIIQIVLTKK